MEKQARENLLSFIKELNSNIKLQEKVTQELIKNRNISIHDIISNIKDYDESLKCLIFNRIIAFTNQHQINIKEFNEINDSLNIQFNLVEEFIDNNLPELFDRISFSFMELYFNIESGLESIYYTIKDL